MRELAFFVVNFGYTKRDFEELTMTERLFVMKAWENKKILDTSLTAKAFFNAYANANRKKNSKPMPLWKKKKENKYNIIELKKQFDDVLEHENNSSKDWVKMLYEGRS